MALPVSGDTVTGAYLYTVGLDVNALGLTDVTTLTTDASDMDAVFGTDPSTGNLNVTIGGITYVTTTVGASESPTAFTFTVANPGDTVNPTTTYLLSNTAVAASAVQVSLGNLLVLVGGLGGPLNVQQGATDYVACYLAGTMILTDGGEMPVETLSIGDNLVTVAGKLRPIKWIGTRSYDLTAAPVGKSAIMPVCIKRGALADNVPRRDLFVSPRHALFIHGSLFPAGLLVNGTSISTVASIEAIHYFHVELDSHDVILAEGAASETFVDDNSRAMFHNAPDYRRRYPAETHGRAEYYAPRIETGYELEAMVQRLAARGRLLQANGRVAVLGPLLGSFDQLTAGAIVGWARNTHAPERPVDMVILDNDVVIAEIAAKTYRPDLQAAGIGNGCHAFAVTIPAQLSGFSRHVISVRRRADGAELPGSPMVIEPTMATSDRVVTPRHMPA